MPREKQIAPPPDVVEPLYYDLDPIRKALADLQNQVNTLESVLNEVGATVTHLQAVQQSVQASVRDVVNTSVAMQADIGGVHKAQTQIENKFAAIATHKHNGEGTPTINLENVL
jgi:hypothetical protein